MATRLGAAAGEILATLNFAADRTDGGTWSNRDQSLNSQRHDKRVVPIGDAATLDPPATLDREGFELFDQPWPHARWDDAAWIDDIYIPFCMAFIRELTGADLIGLLHPGVLHRRASQSANDATHVPPARFVHLDMSPDGIVGKLTDAAGEGWQDIYSRVTMFNFWRSISQPPQNVPLALCDQRTLDRDDLVVGHLIEPGDAKTYPYATAVFNPAQRWWCFPNVRTDEVIVFKGFEYDVTRPVGCLHSGFDHPAPQPGASARESIEHRVLAFFV